MKKCFIILLVCAIGTDSFGRALQCRDLFTSVESSTIYPDMDPVELRAKLQGSESLYFLRANNPYTFIKEKLTGNQRDPLFFDLKSFHQKTDFYKNILIAKNMASVNRALYEIRPKDLEEALALLEAKTQLNPKFYGIDVVQKWLAGASPKNIEKMKNLLEFKGDESPPAIRSKIAKLYLLIHSPRENLKYIFNVPLTEQADSLIARRATISLLSHDYEDAISEMGISKATGGFAFSKGFYEKNPNAVNYALNVALASVEMYFFGMPIFASIHDLHILEGQIEKITETQKLQIINRNFSGLPLNLQKRLVRIAKSEIIFKRFLQVLGIATMIWMFYLLQNAFRHSFASNSSTKDRMELESKALQIFIASTEVTTQAEPTPQQIAEAKADIAEKSDLTLEKDIQNQWYKIKIAADFKSGKIPAMAAVGDDD